MQVTVIGIYDNIDEAKETSGDLESQGFSAEDISIAEEDGREQAEAPHEGRVAKFIHDLFGSRHAGASTHGRYVLTLYAEEARAAAAADVMNRHHALSQRTEPQRDVTPASEPVQADNGGLSENVISETPSPERLDAAGGGEELPSERMTAEDGAIGSIAQAFGGEDALGRQPYQELTQERATAEYHEHFDANYEGTGVHYEEVLVAYQFGARAAQDPRFQGGQFSDFESELKREWESEAAAGPWEHAKSAIRHAWERATNKAV
jgi:hypothetical protein